jgi:hypothetical protein
MRNHFLQLAKTTDNICSLSYISLSNQCTLIILYYTIQFTIKLVRHISNPYFGTCIVNYTNYKSTIMVHFKSTKLTLSFDFVDLGGLVVSVLATGPKVRRFDPDRGRWIFKGNKNPEHNFLRRGSKAVSPTS